MEITSYTISILELAQFTEIMFYLYTVRGKNLHRWKISRKQDGRYILGELDETAGMVESGYASVRELIRAHRGLTGKPLLLANGRSVKLTRDYIIPNSVAGTPVGHNQ